MQAYGICLVEQVEVLMNQFEWKKRDSPTETRLADRYRSLSFVTPANFPRAVTGGGWSRLPTFGGGGGGGGGRGLYQVGNASRRGGTGRP